MFGVGPTQIAALQIGELPDPPVNTVAPAVTGDFELGATLTCSTGTWDNVPTSYAYQWVRDGVDIGGATANTHVCVSADVGEVIHCRVTASNAGGSDSADSNSDTVIVADLLDIIHAHSDPQTFYVPSYDPSYTHASGLKPFYTLASRVDQVAVAAVADSIGFHIDFSKAATIGAERLTNGDYAADANWTKGTGWTISSGEAHYDGSGSNAQLQQSSTGIAYPEMGIWEFDVSDVGANATVALNMSGANWDLSFASITGNGHKTSRGTVSIPGAGNRTINYQASNTTNPDRAFDLDNSSLKIIAGTPAFQYTTGRRGTLRQGGASTTAYVWRLDGSDDSHFCWIHPSSAMTIAWAGTPGATSQSDVIVGSNDGSSNRCNISLDASGLLQIRLGTTTATHGSDIRTLHGTIVLTFSGGNYRVVWKEAGQAAVVYTGTYSGSVPTTNAQFLALGANNNNNGGNGNNFAGDSAFWFIMKDAANDAEADYIVLAGDAALAA